MKKKAEIKHKISTSYLESVYTKEFLKIVPRAVKAMKAFHKKHPFDAIAFTGSSGAALAYVLSYRMKLPLMHVRKDGSSEHCSLKVEGTVSSKRYVIVDDFIGSGTTIKNIVHAIKTYANPKSKPVGIFLYAPTTETKRFVRPQNRIDIPIFK